MVGAAIIIILLGSWLLNLVGQGLSTYNVKQEGHKHMQQVLENIRQTRQENSKKWNVYYDDRTGDLNYNFYRDGSVRQDSRTHRMYDMGQYFYNADGYDCRHKKAPEGAELAPKKKIYTY
jgi:hypothetical protein